MNRNAPPPSNWTIALGPLLIASCIGFLFGIPKLQIYLKSKIEPQTLSVKDLFTKGPGNNLHINLTDLRFGTKYKVCGKPDTGKWGLVIVPAFSKDSRNDSTGPMVLIGTYKINSEEELKTFRNQKSVEGILVNGIKDNKKYQDEMAGNYGRSDTTKLPFLDNTESVPDLNQLAMFLGLAIFCLPLTLFAIAKRVGEISLADRTVPDMSPPPPPAQARAGGVVSIIVAVALAKFCVLDVIAAAEHGVSYIWWIPMLAAFAPIGLVFGLYSLAFGKSIHDQLKNERGLMTTTGVIIESTLAGIPALLMVWWIYTRLHDLGYTSAIPPI